MKKVFKAYPTLRANLLKTLQVALFPCALFGTAVLFACLGLFFLSPRPVGVSYYDAGAERLTPQAPMAGALNAALLVNDPRFQNYTALTPSEISAGELLWPTALHNRRSLFSLNAMESKVRELTAPGDTCVCYLLYQLPYNIVFLPSIDLVMYEPRVALLYGEELNVELICPLHELLEEGRAVNSQERKERHTHAYNSHGLVSYYTKEGLSARRQLNSPQFPCLQHCISFFPLNQQ